MFECLEKLPSEFVKKLAKELRGRTGIGGDNPSISSVVLTESICKNLLMNICEQGYDIIKRNEK